MARKERKYHYIYKTTNLKNGKYYIGMHSTDNLEDGYMGSGKRLRRSLRKYGKENFKFEILEFLINKTLMIEREKKLVNEDILKDPMCMNLMIGGKGGFISVEQQKNRSITGGRALAERLKKDEKFRKQHSEKSSKTIKETIKNGKIKAFDWTGRNHTEETKLKMSGHKRQNGEKNSQFGTCWIRNDELKLNKKIKKEELNNYLCNGWVKGIKMNYKY